MGGTKAISVGGSALPKTGKGSIPGSEANNGMAKAPRCWQPAQSPLQSPLHLESAALAAEC